METPALQLDGLFSTVGTEHYNATLIQRRNVGGTYGRERRIKYMALRKAGISIQEAKVKIRFADE